MCLSCICLLAIHTLICVTFSLLPGVGGWLLAASAFRKLSSIYVFSYFPFGFEGRIWDLIVSVPEHCLSFYFSACGSSWTFVLTVLLISLTRQQSDCMHYLEITTDIVLSCAGSITSPRRWLFLDFSINRFTPPSLSTTIGLYALFRDHNGYRCVLCRPCHVSPYMDIEWLF